MDFAMIGSLDQYMKNQRLQMQWEIKKRNGNVNAHTRSLSDLLKKTPAAAAAPQQIDDERERSDTKLKEIKDKVLNGQKLTPDERRYLQAKDPMTYQKLRSVEADQKSYERELRRCKTKEDVQRLKTMRVGASLAAVNSVANNPHISKAKKLELCQIEKLRCDKLEASTLAFVRKGEYAKLPTEAEKAKAEAEEREERGEEKVPETEASGRQTTEESGSSKDAEGPKPREQGETEPKQRVESPERRKLRQARARAAYARVYSQEEEAPAAPVINARA